MSALAQKTAGAPKENIVQNQGESLIPQWYSKGIPPVEVLLYNFEYSNGICTYDLPGRLWETRGAICHTTRPMCVFRFINRVHNAVKGPSQNKAQLLNSSEHPPIHCCQFFSYV